MAYDISHHNRLKDKPVSTFGKKPFKGKSKNRKGNTKVTKLELNYLSWLNDNRDRFTCIVCECHGVEFHHVKRDSTDKKNHKRLLPLCEKHHKSSLDFSAHGTPKKFRATYPMEFQYIMADEIYNNYLKEK